MSGRDRAGNICGSNHRCADWFHSTDSKTVDARSRAPSGSCVDLVQVNPTILARTLLPGCGVAFRCESAQFTRVTTGRDNVLCVDGAHEHPGSWASRPNDLVEQTRLGGAWHPVQCIAKRVV